MTLTTHAITGAAVASLLPTHPVLGIALAFCSHFIIDAIPHYDYEIKSPSVHPHIGAKMKFDIALVKDIGRIGLDALLGLVLAVSFFHSFLPFWILFFAAIAGMVPDPLQFVHAHFKHEPLVTLQRFHQWIHSNNKLTGRLVFGIVTQSLLVIVVVTIRYLTFLKFNI